MSTFNTLLHGSAAQAADILGGDNPPDDIASLRAALTNAFDKIDRLERRLKEKRRPAIKAPAACLDCGTAYSKQEIGQTCSECGRGVIDET
jgi:predicted Zn-ribbon and HTH transcriptional regulator